MVQCPRCSIQVSELVPIDGALVKKLELIGETGLPASVCAGCISDLKKKASSSGGILIAHEKAKEQQRMRLWKSRVNLIKQGRALMQRKLYSEAAISYEKYLKILEIVFDVKKGTQLTPELFKDTARTTELTVVASTYWDLLRIYDSHPKYGERQQYVAKQLATFVTLTPIYPDIVRKAEIFLRTARNQNTVKNFLKVVGKDNSRCFIATSAFENQNALEVIKLREIRDNLLMQSKFGRLLVEFYYIYSPRVACILDKHDHFKPAIRALLRALIKCVSTVRN